MIPLDRQQVKEKERTVEVAFSSEEPCVRFWGIEILSHAPGAMNMSRMKKGAAVLEEHRPPQIGVIDSCRCDKEDRRGRAIVRFSKSAKGEEVFQDVLDEIRQNVSVGYMIDEEPVQVKPEDMDDGLKNLSIKEQLPVYLIKKWTPYEVSFVAIPADTSVGVGRSEDEIVPVVATDTKALLAELCDAVKQSVMENLARNIETAITETHNASAAAAANQPPAGEKEERVMPESKKELSLEEIEQDRQRTSNAAAQKERERVNEIHTRASKHGIPHFIRDKAITEGTSIEEFRGICLTRIGEGTPLDTPAAELGLTRSDLKRYSIARAILSMDKNANVDAGFERECHAELLKRGVTTIKGGILVPYDVMRKRANDRFQRDLDTTSSGGALGGYLVGTDHAGSEFIDVLRNRMLIRALGARILSGLKGSVVIPRRTAGAATYWVAEGVAPTEGANTYGQLSLTPKNIAANIDYTRNLLLQSDPSVDALVNGDLAIALALGIDAAAFKGTGADGQPTGIALTANIGGFTGTSLDWAAILNAETDVATANADAATCAYITTPAVRALLKARVKASSTWSPIWEDAGTPFAGGAGGVGNGSAGSGRVNGYRAEVSNQLTAATMFFGDFSQLVLAEWGVLELMVNPYTQSKAGIIEVTAFQTVDVGVRYPGAFSYASSIT